MTGRFKLEQSRNNIDKSTISEFYYQTQRQYLLVFNFLFYVIKINNFKEREKLCEPYRDPGSDASKLFCFRI